MTKVPTVEEIRERMKNGSHRSPVTKPELANANAQLKDENAALKEELARKESMLQKRKVTPGALKRTLDDILDKYNVEPAEELIKLATETQAVEVGDKIVVRHVLDVESRIAIWRDLMSYRMPKLKATEIKSKQELEINVTINRFTPMQVPVASNTIVDVTPTDERKLEDAKEQT